MRIRFPDTAFKFSERQQLWHFPFISAVIKLIDLQTLLLNKPLHFFSILLQKRDFKHVHFFCSVTHTTGHLYWYHVLNETTKAKHCIPASPCSHIVILKDSLTAWQHPGYSNLRPAKLGIIHASTIQYITIYCLYLSQTELEPPVIRYRWQLKLYSVTFL